MILFGSFDVVICIVVFYDLGCVVDLDFEVIVKLVVVNLLGSFEVVCLMLFLLCDGG